MQEWVPEFLHGNLRIVALTTDAPEKNLRVSERLRLSIPILSDPDGRILKRLEMWDARWKIAAYGYYLLGPDLQVLAHFKGRWEATEQAKRFLLEKVHDLRNKAS